MYVWEDIPANFLSYNFPSAESYFAENYADDATPYFVGTTTTSFRKSVLSYPKTVFLVCLQSNERKRWNMSPNFEFSRVRCSYSNRVNNKVLESKKTIRNKYWL